MFFVKEYFLTIASYQFIKNDWIFMSHALFLVRKIFSKTLLFSILKMSKKFPNIVIKKKSFFKKNSFNDSKH